MSFTKNITKILDNINTDRKSSDTTLHKESTCDSAKDCTYAVTTSNKNDETRCSTQRSFISIHSTDQCQIDLTENKIDEINDLNVEVISLNTVFPSTSEESLSEENCMKKSLKTTYVPSSSKSATASRVKSTVDPLRSSEINIAKNTMYVVGSNPGEPKICYDNSSKVSKTMKKLMRKKDKHKIDKSNNTDEKAGKLLTRGILKDQCPLECTGDSTNTDKDILDEECLIDYVHKDYNKHVDKNVKFNTQVVIIHFTGDICLGQSVETLSKEKDQQERNSELRKTFLSKYNELWSKQK